MACSGKSGGCGCNSCMGWGGIRGDSKKSCGCGGQEQRRHLPAATWRASCAGGSASGRSRGFAGAVAAESSRVTQAFFQASWFANRGRSILKGRASVAMQGRGGRSCNWGCGEACQHGIDRRWPIGLPIHESSRRLLAVRRRPRTAAVGLRGSTHGQGRSGLLSGLATEGEPECCVCVDPYSVGIASGGPRTTRNSMPKERCESFPHCYWDSSSELCCPDGTPIFPCPDGNDLPPGCNNEVLAYQVCIERNLSRKPCDWPLVCRESYEALRRCCNKECPPFDPRKRYCGGEGSIRVPEPNPDVQRCCYRHDCCYDIGGNEAARKVCDYRFWACLIIVGADWWPDFVLADLYWGAVRAFGKKFFRYRS